MTMTDPIADMLTRVRNANSAMHDSVSMPYSKLKASIAEILVAEGYINSYKVVEDKSRPGKRLEISLKYTKDRKRTISGVKRVSKPGLRVYKQHTHLPKVLGGMGVAILSTSQGLLTDRQAGRKGIGGEVLCYVW
jgi:small subunit ribosomal protein S8